MSYFNIQDYDVGAGVSKRFPCPNCGGTNTLSISNEGGKVVWQCFRNSCGLRGAKHYTRNLNEIKLALQNQKHEVQFEVPDYIVEGIANEDCYNLLKKYNSLQPVLDGVVKVGFDPKENRLVFYLIDNGKVVGLVGRTLGYGIPKVRIYMHSKSAPFICNNNSSSRHDNGRLCVIVEDAFSAMSVSVLGVTGIALLGTNLKDEYIPYIKPYKQVYIALDKDATRKAIKISEKLKYYGIDAKVLFLDKDFKDMSTEELIEYAARYIT